MKAIVVCVLVSFVAIVIAWNIDPGFVERALPPLSRFRLMDPVPPAPIPPAEVQGKLAAKRNNAGSARHSLTEPEVAPLPDIITPVVAPVPVKAALKPAPKRPILSVSAEDAALLSSNSHNGRVLTVLRKGDVVEPQFRFNDQGQEWTFVNVTDQLVSGFLKSGELREPEKQAEEHAAP